MDAHLCLGHHLSPLWSCTCPVATSTTSYSICHPHHFGKCTLSDWLTSCTGVAGTAWPRYGFKRGFMPPFCLLGLDCRTGLSSYWGLPIFSSKPKSLRHLPALTPGNICPRKSMHTYFWWPYMVLLRSGFLIPCWIILASSWYAQGPQRSQIMQSYSGFHKNAAFASFNTESSLPSLKYSCFCPVLPQSRGLEVKKIIQHLSETAVARAFSAQLTTITDFSVYKEK